MSEVKRLADGLDGVRQLAQGLVDAGVIAEVGEVTEQELSDGSMLMTCAGGAWSCMLQACVDHPGTWHFMGWVRAQETPLPDAPFV
jgi:hypothetical protein